MTGGWIVLHREVLESYLFDMPGNQFKVALAILLRANWTEGEVWRGAERVKVQRGSFICSRETLAKTAKVGIQTVRTSLRNLEKAGFLTRVSTNHHTLVSVTNYDRYQDIPDRPNQQPNQRLTSDQPALNQPLTTNEQGNKKNKGTSRATQLPSSWEPNQNHVELARDLGVDVRRESAQFRDHHAAKGSTFKIWDRVFNTWLRNAAKWSPAKPAAARDYQSLLPTPADKSDIDWGLPE